MADSLTELQNTVTSSATAMTNLFNLAAGPTAIVGFVAEGIFKGIRLGRQIREAQRKANADLKAKILAEGILRTPIVVDLTPLAVRAFYQDPLVMVDFPALKAFTPELDEFEQTGGRPSTATWEILKAAKTLIPMLATDPNLDENPDLKEIFTIGLNPVEPRPRELVLEYMSLFPNRSLMYESHYARLETFWREKLQLEIQTIEEAQIEAQTALNMEVTGLIKTAIFDPTGGFAAKGLNLAKSLKTISIKNEIAELEEKRNNATAAEKTAIDAKIKALNAWITRIGATS